MIRLFAILIVAFMFLTFVYAVIYSLIIADL